MTLLLFLAFGCAIGALLALVNLSHHYDHMIGGKPADESGNEWPEVMRRG